MATSKEKLQHQRNLRLLRENRALDFLKKKDKPTPSSSTPTLKEADFKFDQQTETFSDRTDLLDWLDDLVNEWGVEPTFDDIWAAMQKEPRKLAGFVDSMGMTMLKHSVRQEADIRAAESNHPSSAGWDEDPMFEGLAEEEDTWEKSKERREEHQKEIQKGVLEEGEGIESPTSLASQALASALGAKVLIDRLFEAVGNEDAVFEVRAIGLRDPHKVKQVVKFARRDAMGLVATLKTLVQLLPSEVVAEQQVALTTQEECGPKSNLDKVLEACSMDEEEEAK